MRRVSCASTRSWSRSRGFAAAARMAGSVISWNTIRWTGTFGLRVSSRCQAMASPSRSGSVARRARRRPSARRAARRPCPSSPASRCRAAGTRCRRPRRAGPTPRPCTWPGRPRHRAEDRGCGRPRTRRRSPCPGRARSSWPWSATRRSPSGASGGRSRWRWAWRNAGRRPPCAWAPSAGCRSSGSFRSSRRTHSIVRRVRHLCVRLRGRQYPRTEGLLPLRTPRVPSVTLRASSVGRTGA